MGNLLLIAAAMLCLSGMAWIALAMDVHWKQVKSGALSAANIRLLRILGGAALGASLLCCLGVDHVSMASLVWIMLLAGSALSIALTLAWQPKLLLPFIVWLER